MSSSGPSLEGDRVKVFLSTRHAATTKEEDHATRIDNRKFLYCFA